MFTGVVHAHQNQQISLYTNFLITPLLISDNDTSSECGMIFKYILIVCLLDFVICMCGRVYYVLFTILLCKMPAMFPILPLDRVLYLWSRASLSVHSCHLSAIVTNL